MKEKYNHWTAPEPDPIQGFNPVTSHHYNPGHTIGEEFIVGSEGGAVAYWGGVHQYWRVGFHGPGKAIFLLL